MFSPSPTSLALVVTALPATHLPTFNFEFTLAILVVCPPFYYGPGNSFFSTSYSTVPFKSSVPFSSSSISLANS